MELELRGPGGISGLEFSGMVVPFNVLSHPLGGFREKVAPDAFRDTLASDEDILALAHHDLAQPIASREGGSLKLWTDSRGLHFKLNPADTQAARDLAAQIRHRTVRGMSFGFVAEDDRWESINGQIVRTLRSVRLMEISPTAAPAYGSATSIRISAEEGRSLPSPRWEPSAEFLRRRLELEHKHRRRHAASLN